MIDLTQAYKKHSKNIFTYIYLRVNKNREIADDILQDTFYRAFKYKDKYNSKLSNERTWLTSIAKNLVTDYYKSRYKDVEQIPENTAYVEQENIDNNVLYEQIIEKLNLLSEKDKELIILRYINEFDLEEIAQLLEMSYDSVKVASNRAIKKLRDLIGT